VGAPSKRRSQGVFGSHRMSPSAVTGALTSAPRPHLDRFRRAAACRATFGTARNSQPAGQSCGVRAVPTSDECIGRDELRLLDIGRRALDIQELLAPPLRVVGFATTAQTEQPLGDQQVKDRRDVDGECQRACQSDARS